MNPYLSSTSTNVFHIQGVFGMNVDVLNNSPASIKWFFIVGISLTAVVLGIAFIAARINKQRRA
jgi:Mg2+ and Co2+ transporter CorA